MKRKRITRENLSLLSKFFNYEHLKADDSHLASQIHNLTVYLDTNINYEDVRSEATTILRWLNGILDQGKLFTGRRTTGRLDMECDKAVELVTYSIKISRIVPGWFICISGRLCRHTNCPVWWKIASIAWEERRLILRRETGEIITILNPPDQTAGYCVLGVPVDVPPPAIDEGEEQLVSSFLQDNK